MHCSKTFHCNKMVISSWFETSSNHIWSYNLFPPFGLVEEFSVIWQIFLLTQNISMQLRGIGTLYQNTLFIIVPYEELNLLWCYSWISNNYRFEHARVQELKCNLTWLEIQFFSSIHRQIYKESSTFH